MGRLAAGWIDPVMPERIPSAKAARGCELLKCGNNLGKVVLIAGE